MKEKKVNRQMYSIICKECKKEGEVPFQPRNPDDVLCAECFQKAKASGGSAPTEVPAPTEDQA